MIRHTLKIGEPDPLFHKAKISVKNIDKGLPPNFASKIKRIKAN